MKTIKDFFKKNRISILIPLLFIIIIWLAIRNTYLYITIKEKEVIINNKSEIEVLEAKAIEANNKSNNHLMIIKKLRKEISNNEKAYELELLRERCIKSQIERKIDWLEYQLNYCDNNKNLEYFRLKK